MLIYFIFYFLIIVLYIVKTNVRVVLRFAQHGQSLEQSNGPNLGVDSVHWYIILSVSLLTLLFGLRSQTMGIDLLGYLPSFDYLSKCSWTSIFKMKSYLNYEKGYVLLNKLVGSIQPSRQFFLFVCAAMSVIPAGIVIHKYSKNELFSLVILMGLPVMLLPFSALRQGIAIGVTLLAFLEIPSRKPVRFVLLTLLAASFHSSALVFLIAYPIYHIRKSRPISIASVVALPVFYFARLPLFILLSKLFKKNAAIDNNNAIVLLIVFFLIYLFCLLAGNQREKETNGLTNLFWLACACQSMGGLNSITIRVGYYFMIYLALLLPSILSSKQYKNSDRFSALLTGAVFSAFLIFGLYSLRYATWAESYPYFFYWER